MFAILLLFTFIQTGFCINSHQFHFSGGNVAYGKVPRAIHIVGYWYIHRNDSNFLELFEKGYTEKDLMGTLYICKENVEVKLLDASSMGTKRRKTEKVNRLLSGKSSSEVKPFIEEVDNCEVLKLDDYQLKSKYIGGKPVVVKHFNIIHNFTQHSSVLFVDAWGVAAFHYRAKNTDSQKLKYCENDEVSFPVIFNKRPMCPRPVLQSTVVEDGLLTVYKPNILSIQKKAYRCYLETTFITTYENLGGGTRNNLPFTTRVQPIVDTAECWKWIKTESCESYDFKRKINYLAFDRFNGTLKRISDTRMATVNTIRPLKYTKLWTHRYTIANCIIDIGYVRTTPPFNNILTPWGHISSDYLYESNITRSGGEVIVWNAFEKEEICNYVPMSSYDVKRITYNTKDFLEQDPNPGAKEMYHFLSDAEKSVYTSDDTQVTTHDLFNCIDDEADQILYAINDGLILSWRKGYTLNDDDNDLINVDIHKSQIKYHAHFAFDDVTKIVDSSTNSEINAMTGGTGNNECETDDDMKRPECRQSYASTTERTLDGNISSDDIIAKKEETTEPVLSEQDRTTGLFSMINYLAYKFREYQNHDVVRRAQMWCENQQHLYDLQLVIAQSSPSSIISSYINRPVHAERIGSGVYDTYYCDVIDDYIIVDNLFVANNDLAPKIRVPLQNLYRKAGVRIDENRCFTMPIIIFKERNGQRYKIGQMNHDHTISTISMPWVEECKYGRSFLHYIGKEVHLFESYKLESTTNIDDLYDYATRLKRNVKHLEGMREKSSTEKRKNIEPLLENTRFVDIHTKFQPSLHKPIVLGFQNTAMYSYKQKRKVITNIEELLAHANVARFDDKKLETETAGKVFFSKSDNDIVDFFKGVTSGVKVLVEGVGDIAGTIVDTGGEFVEGIFETGGDVIETAIETGGDVVGKAVGTASDLLGNVADFFTGGFMKIIIIVVAVAAVGLFLYYIVKNRLLSDDNNASVHSSYMLPPTQIPLHEKPFYNQPGLERRVTHEYVNDF